MSKFGLLIGAVSTLLLSACQMIDEERIGLECTGTSTLTDTTGKTSRSDKLHFVVDLKKRQLILSDPMTREYLELLPMVADERSYSGQIERRTKSDNAGETSKSMRVGISRQDGSISLSLLESFQSARVSGAAHTGFEGKCEKENPDQKQDPKF